MSQKPREPELIRPALAPGILGAIVLLAGLALLDSDGFTVIRFAVAILAAITAYFVAQARHWWWLFGLVPIVVAWNPVWVIELHGQWWVAAQYVAALVFLCAAFLTRMPRPH